MPQMLFLYFMLKAATCTCSNEYRNGFERVPHRIQKIGVMPERVNENSGLVATKDGFYWTHNDSGGQPVLYLVDTRGNVRDSVVLPNAKNVDWEDLTQDDKGNLYVGDFGNNSYARQDLKIYKVSEKKTEKITFHYADQTPNTPEYDCEAFFWHNDSLYLFTKSRWDKRPVTRLYVMPDRPGNYAVSPRGEWYINSPVTAAAVSPDGSEFALLTYGKTLFFGVEPNGNVNFDNPKGCIRTRRKQTEGITYDPDGRLIFSNEQGQIYRITRKKLR